MPVVPASPVAAHAPLEPAINYLGKVEQYLTVAQFECASTLSRATIYRLIAAGAIESRTVGKRRLIPASALEALGVA